MRKFLILQIVLISAFAYCKDKPQSDRLAELYRRVQTFAVDHDLIVVGTDAGIRTLVASNKKLQTLQRFVLPDAITALTFYKGTLFAAGPRGLWRFRVQNNKLTLLNYKKSSGTIKDLKFKDKLAVAALGSLGIRIMRVQGTDLIPLRLIPTTDYCYRVQVVNKMVYAACGYQGLVQIDLTDPANLKIHRVVRTPGQLRDLFVDGDRAYMALGQAGFGVMYLPSGTLLYSHKLIDGGRSVAKKDNIIYVSDGRGGIAVFSCAKKCNYIKNLKEHTYSVYLRVINNLLYSADDYRGLSIWDLNKPEEPQILYAE